MFVVVRSPDWDGTFIMYDVLEGTGKEMMISPCKELCMYVCRVIEENEETYQNDRYAYQYLNTIQCDQIVCNAEDFT